MTIFVLRFSQLQEAEELQKAKMADTEVLMAEFTKRISESERKCQTAVKVREILLADEFFAFISLEDS